MSATGNGAVTDSAAEALFIAPATRSDLAAIVAILASDRLFGARDTTDPSVFPDYEAAFDAIEADANLTLYVARRGNEVLGTFQLILFPVLLRRGATIAIAEGVHVHPDARGLGIGAAMMAFAVEEARRRGAASIQLTSNKKRTDAHRFYERIGFERRHEGFKIDLDDRI
ncbi:GNAT family N-acetyltransferase [Ancylobacter pratisalsi]|uniref:GNAT family N-acetyltransferase n=1 Tax=Ancylobacter pratisalsi TaxID=1745854 RepID=A0A6P1YH67_9HYPH|nr:GNAT family N-acetyltransferase [Ancylobacter pratisalsi]QIB32300.1 GNAT family N-acetyltransferase [Ancylobacter pratisalsi]